MTHHSLRIGLVINPWAGIGGPAGLRGSDGEAVRETALARGSRSRSIERCARFLTALGDVAGQVEWLCGAGEMGESLLVSQGWVPVPVGGAVAQPSSAADTRSVVRAFMARGADLVLFVGGDGTARDVCSELGTSRPALGIPAGVKMYSGVFAVSPEAAAETVSRIIRGRAVPLVEADVRDIDEEAFRHDRVNSRHFGEMRVPGVQGCLQHIKCGAVPGDEETRDEIAAGIVARMEPGVLYVIGTGTTPKAVLQALHLDGSLLGVDAVRDGALVGRDLDARALEALVAGAVPVRLVVTVTGGQGFLFGRGNQQLSADVLRRIGMANVEIVATPAKLAALEGRPLLVDTGDRELDHALAGLHPVWTGYEERVLYRVAAADAPVSAEA